MTSEGVVGIVAVFYCVANLGSMGLELDIQKATKSLRSLRLVSLTLGWSWLIGPAWAYVITRILPLSEGHAIGMLLLGLAPTAPLLPILIRNAKADMDLAAAMMPFSVLGIVLLMPLLAPLLIPGASVSSLALANKLFLSVLLPLVVGALVGAWASDLAAKVLPYVKKLAGLSSVALVVFTVFLYGEEFIDALGSFAVAAQVLWIVVIGLLAYLLGFGMTQGQRSALSLGVCSRNGGATLVAFTALPAQDPDVLVMLLIGIPVPILVWLALARFYGSRATRVPENASC